MQKAVSFHQAVWGKAHPPFINTAEIAGILITHQTCRLRDCIVTGTKQLSGNLYPVIDQIVNRPNPFIFEKQVANASRFFIYILSKSCLLYTSDAADD